MPDPLELPQTVQASSSSSSQYTNESPLGAIGLEAKKTDMEWAKEFIQEYKATKKRMNWKTCFTLRPT